MRGPRVFQHVPRETRETLQPRHRHHLPQRSLGCVLLLLSPYAMWSFRRHSLFLSLSVSLSTHPQTMICMAEIISMTLCFLQELHGGALGSKGKRAAAPASASSSSQPRASQVCFAHCCALHARMHTGVRSHTHHAHCHIQTITFQTA